MIKTRARKTLIISCLLVAIFWICGTLFLFSPQSEAIKSVGKKIQNTFSEGYHLSALISSLKSSQPKSILVLFQNDLELRPTGGFITAVGYGKLVNGEIQDLDVVASNSYNEPTKKTLDLPSPMDQWLSTLGLMFRDANWDVDFATSASNLSTMYQDLTNQPVDLVIAMTTKTNEILLEKTGPLTFYVNGHALNVDKYNVTDVLEHYTDRFFADLGLAKKDRKEVLAAYATALLPKVKIYAQNNPSETVRLASSLFKTYDIQIWSSLPDLATHLKSLDTYRAVKNYKAADSLLIVDTNLKARKTDAVIKQDLKYEIDLDDQQPRAKLSITYQNTGVESPLYTDYNDYLRIYVPFGSKLIKSNQNNVETYDRHGRTVFANMFVLPPGQSKTLVFEYTLGNLNFSKAQDYKLFLERQPGTRQMLAKIIINSQKESYTQQTVLDQDHIVTIDRID